MIIQKGGTTIKKEVQLSKRRIYTMILYKY